jgi:hypothetical protein
LPLWKSRSIRRINSVYSPYRDYPIYFYYTKGKPNRMEKYITIDGVIVQAELVTEGELSGFWHTIDANNVEGHVTDEQFKMNFSPVTATSDAVSKSPKGKQA